MPPPTLRRLAVDLAALSSALDEDDDAPTRSFFDLATGAVEPVPRRDPDDDGDSAAETLFADVRGAPDRWIGIAPMPSWKRHQLRTRFADDVEDLHARLLLLEALDEVRPFARFAQVLRRHPVLEAAWDVFRDRALGGEARRWLAGWEIEVVASPAAGGPDKVTPTS